MRFKMAHDGTELVGRSYDDIVRAMADTKMENVKDLARYRIRTAERVKQLFDADIKWTTNRGFVKSLVDNGLLEPLS